MSKDKWGFSVKPRNVQTVREELRIAEHFMLYDQRCWVDGPERTEAMRVIAELEEELESLSVAKG